jgi:hypothetical protein
MAPATCSVEVGLLRKKPCGHAAVAECSNCLQPLCSEHALPQLAESGKRSGKFLCKECSVALKEHDKSIAAVARSQEEKKKAEMAKAAMAGIVQPPAKKPPAAPGAPAAAPAAAAPAKPAAPAADPKAAEAAKKDDSGALEFTPKDGNLSYTRKKDGEG